MQSQVACHGCHGKLGRSWLGSVIFAAGCLQHWPAVDRAAPVASGQTRFVMDLGQGRLEAVGWLADFHSVPASMQF